MARIAVPKVDLVNICNEFVKFMQGNRSTPEQCKTNLQSEINRQGKLFADIHTKVAELMVSMHKTTQGLYRGSEAQIKNAGALIDLPEKERNLLIQGLEQSLVHANQELADFKAQKVEMINMQPMRAGWIDKDGEVALGKATYDSLNQLFHSYRDAPLEAYMKAASLNERMAEHITRIEDMLKNAKKSIGAVLQGASAVAKEAAKTNKSTLEGIQGDMKGALERCKGYHDDLPRLFKLVEKEKADKEKKKAEFEKTLKNDATMFEKIARDLKTCKTKIKTCRLRVEEIKKLASESPSITLLASLAKGAADHIQTTTKELEAAQKELEGYIKSLPKWEQKLAKV